MYARNYNVYKRQITEERWDERPRTFRLGNIYSWTASWSSSKDLRDLEIGAFGNEIKGQKKKKKKEQSQGGETTKA